MARVRLVLVGPSPADKALPASRDSQTNSVGRKAEVKVVRPLETFLTNSKRCLVISREVVDKKHRLKVKTL